MQAADETVYVCAPDAPRRWLNTLIEASRVSA
jgi:hypothetical protein